MFTSTNRKPHQMDTPEKITVELDDVLAPAGDKKVTLIANDDGSPAVGFVIVGKDSPQYRKRASELRSAGIRRQSSSRTKIDMKQEKGALEFAKVLEDNEIELAVAVVIDFFGLTHEGEPLEFSEEMVRKIFKAKPSWREKVSAELEGEDGFLKLSSANSAISRAANSASQE